MEGASFSWKCLITIIHTFTSQMSLLTPLVHTSGPISRILASERPISLVFPSQGGLWKSMAERLAWALYVYLGLDVNLVSDREMMGSSLPFTASSGAGKKSFVILGSSHVNLYGRYLLETFHSEFTFFANGSFKLHGRTFVEEGTGKSYPLDEEKMR